MIRLAAANNNRFVQSTGTLLRFATVGAITTALDLILFATLTAATTPPALANLLSYSCGILLSYVLNRSWTFGVDGSRLQALKFVLSTLTGLLISTVLVAFLTTVIPAIDAKLISVPIVFGWNYLAARMWVFNVAEVPQNKRSWWFS
ncbi:MULTISPECIES: GtrA family protein [unclassified Mesorhizobium]|uniref:GtrA family protein n=1 Tax=unclassified Mesorhizobium TaxID=325217 RepID=UPI0016780C70|nr:MULTISPECIES: GtrA family protein [unclassified Mesorhizobium]